MNTSTAYRITNSLQSKSEHNHRYNWLGFQFFYWNKSIFYIIWLLIFTTFVSLIRNNIYIYMYYIYTYINITKTFIFIHILSRNRHFNGAKIYIFFIFYRWGRRKWRIIDDSLPFFPSSIMFFFYWNFLNIFEKKIHFRFEKVNEIGEHSSTF